MSPARIAVIGAGPAGSAAAFHLASAGLHTTLIEARPFPRAKVCGEFVSPAATGLLEAIVPPEDLIAAGARRTGTFVLRLGERRIAMPLPSPAWSLSRRALDHLLLERARAAGARVLQPAPVVAVDHGDADAPHATIRLASGDALQAEIVVHADGHGRFCPASPTPKAAGLIGHKCHFRPAEPVEGVVICAAPGAYIGTIQVERAATGEPEATIALVARASLLATHRADIDAMVRDLWPAWDPASRTTPWFSCGVARQRCRPSGHPRAFRIGNAAAAVDPIGGEGIGLALWSAANFAGMLRRSIRTTADARTLRRVQRQADAALARRLCLRRPACRIAAEALMRPRLIAALWPLLTLRRLTLAPWYAATGKPWLLPGVARTPRP